MRNNRTFFLSMLALAMLVFGSDNVFAQETSIITPGAPQALSTLFSIKLSAGYGLGRGRQLYGNNGTDPVYWSAGEGVKLDLGLVLPLLPVDIMNVDGAEFGEPDRYPVVGLEMEFGTGYHLSVGGSTNDLLGNGQLMKTTRRYAVVPIMLGFNARAAFGAGMPSVFIGVGGGLNIKGIYEDHYSFTNSTTTYTRSYDPPIPFIIYGVIGVEIPLAYSPEDGNSIIDLFGQLKLIDGTTYVYDYKVTGSDGSQSVISPNSDQFLVSQKEYARSVSSVALSLGLKINLF